MWAEDGRADGGQVGRKHGGQEIPWAVTGACAWTGEEEPDTMQVCRWWKGPTPEARALHPSERLPDLQRHT